MYLFQILYFLDKTNDDFLNTAILIYIFHFKLPLNQVSGLHHILFSKVTLYCTECQVTVEKKYNSLFLINLIISLSNTKLSPFLATH